ncbi:condensation domain-containing protein [Micromonospora sp. NPDC005298]|uniref:condensation domain-containing protein n=1 Tax=Micromonospora sp. NPDC005298 TaxID=3156873 RepID=UPI0033A729D1
MANRIDVEDLSPTGGEPAVSARPRIYPMSREQEALWLDDLLWDGPSRYLEGWACRFTGQLDIGALEWALGQIISRHEVLRTRLTELDEEPVQIVTDPGPVRMKQLSCSPASLPELLSRIATEPIDLDVAPIRPWLIRVSPDELVLVVQLHHVAIDNWSLNIFRRELMHFYTARVLGRSPSLKPLRMQAGGYAVAQRAAGLDPADLAYWRERMRDVPLSCTIPPDRPASEERAHRAGRHVFTLSPELGQAVVAAGRTLRTTPFSVMAAALAATLWQYGRPDEVIFGTPVSLRGAAADEDMIGYLTDLHPIRLAISRDTSFRTLVTDTKAEVLGAIAHRAVPYAEIVRMTRHSAEIDAPPPCDVTMAVDDMRWEPFSLPGVTAQLVSMPPGHSKFAMHLNLTARKDRGYAGWWTYDADVFDATTAARAASTFTALLTHGVAALDEPLGRLLDPAT